MDRTKLFTSHQAENALGLSASQLTRMRQNRKIGCFKLGGRFFYSPDEVKRVLDSFEIPAITPAVPQLQKSEVVL